MSGRVRRAFWDAVFCVPLPGLSFRRQLAVRRYALARSEALIPTPTEEAR